MDNFKMFVARYKKRVDNLKHYLQNPVQFVIERYNTNEEDLHDLQKVFAEQYPNLKYSFIILNGDKTNMYNHYTQLLTLDPLSNEVTRLV